MTHNKPIYFYQDRWKSDHTFLKVNLISFKSYKKFVRDTKDFLNKDITHIMEMSVKDVLEMEIDLK